MDKFEEIKKLADTFIPLRRGEFNMRQDVRWLIAEVERLRRIEDAAVQWVDSGFTPDGGWHFHEAVKANPRTGKVRNSCD